ncbi:MAG: DNA replication and repair protein RecF [Acidimicrobiia bacterium]|nr:DNA replication and repair protein RecF [Acidimicrobiia bacterium]
MVIRWISLIDIRSYQSLEWAPDSQVNLLIGPNAAGKTNLLEAIGYLSSGRSFRSGPDDVLISFDAESGVIRAGLGNEEDEHLVEIELTRGRPRRIQLDRQRLRLGSDLTEVIRTVTFLPDDLDLIKRGPARRRDLLDQVAVQLWPITALDQSEFAKALRQRNAFLKQRDRDEATLGVWDARLAQSAGRLVSRRARVVDALLPEMERAYRDISSAEVDIALDYRSDWVNELSPTTPAGTYENALSEALTELRSRDMERRMTLVGPHRDEPVLLLDSHDSRFHASQGEQRTLALAIRLATQRLLTESTGKPPILLLDDVFSELDDDRSGALAKLLPDTQTFISSAKREDVPISGRPWSLEGGTLK